MQTGSFSNLQDIFPKTAAKHQVVSQLAEAHACFIMNQLLAEMFKAKGKNLSAKATELKNRVLIIKVRTSSQSQEIALHKLELLEALRQKGIEVASLKIQLT